MIENTVYTQLMNQISQMKLTKAQLKQMLLQQLQVGNEIEGQLIEKEGQLLLKTKLGIQLPISLFGEEIEPGVTTTLEVVANDEKGVVLKPVEQAELPSQMEGKEVTKQVIKQLQLPENDVIKESIHCFIEKQMPLDRQLLLKNYYLNHQTQIPAPVLVNILERTGVLRDSVIQPMGDVKDMGKATLIDHLTEFIKTQELPKETLIQLAKYIETKGYVDLGNIMEEPVSNMAREEKVQSEGRLQIEEALQTEGIPKTKNMTSIIKEPSILLLKDFITRGIKEIVQVDLENLKSLPVNERGEHVKIEHALEEIVQMIEEGVKTPSIKVQLEPIKESVQQFNFLQQQGDMLVLPFVYKEQVKDAEIYFFKPKKNNKGIKKQNYIVVALDMPSIKHVDMHIRQDAKKLTIAIEVENEAIREHMQMHMEKLMAMVGELGYEILQSSCMVKRERESMTLASIKEEKETMGIDYKV